MKFKFTDTRIGEIEKVLNTKFSKRGNQFRALLQDQEQGRRLTLEIFLDIAIGAERNLVNVLHPARICSYISPQVCSQ
jgi:hypothetical protein